MELSEIRKHIHEDHEYYPLDCCVLCENDVAFIDSVGMRWCARHQFRGEFINTMAARGYPGVEGYPALAPGAWFAVQVALIGSDEGVATLSVCERRVA